MSATTAGAGTLLAVTPVTTSSNTVVPNSSTPDQPTSTARATSAVTSAAPGLSGSTGIADDAQTAEAVVRQFVEAANRADSTGVANTFAPQARFDSVGRIYQGRDQIMNRFLVPEVLNIGGRYEILKISQEPGAVTFEFNFRASSLLEHFTYRCVVQGGQIQDVVGRYVSTAPAQVTTLGTGTSAPTSNAPATVQAAGNVTTVASLAEAAPDPAVTCYVNAVNSKNLEGLVNCFAPDGVVLDVSRRINGSEAIRNWAGNGVIGGTLQVISNQPGPNRNRLLVHWAPAGSAGWNAYYTFEFKDSKLTLADLQYA